MNDPKFINVGSKESPVLVPQSSLEPETPQGREFWGGIADGTVAVYGDPLDNLIEITKNSNKE